MKYLLLTTFYILLINFTYAENLPNEISQLKADYNENVDLYCIQMEDSIERLAISKRVSTAFILFLNPELKNTSDIYTGKVIKLPGIKVMEYIGSRSKNLHHKVLEMGAERYSIRKQALDFLIEKNYLAVPILLKALKSKNPDIKENAKEALKNILADQDHFKKYQISEKI
ncbi:MAG: armadillo/beta-catenin-like repeat-containing protein [Lentisphaeraceae bacterium]|nr:armadillo/beta-catenin-like repeat-containing protein [Lentisphaeraceae bacterium]